MSRIKPSRRCTLSIWYKRRSICVPAQRHDAFISHMYMVFESHRVQLCLCSNIPASQMPAHQEAFHRRVSSRASRRRTRADPPHPMPNGRGVRSAHAVGVNGAVSTGGRGNFPHNGALPPSCARDHPYAQYSTTNYTNGHDTRGRRGRTNSRARGSTSGRGASRANGAGVGVNGYGPTHKRRRGSQRANGFPTGTVAPLALSISVLCVLFHVCCCCHVQINLRS